jgi:AraC family transcriptional regulator of adaptative response/methylated-DNA-[protein]-cysteine methyltransferase
MSIDQHSEDIRWNAVSKRDDTEALVFLYAVRTTGVVCRPGCPSRRPKRRNVEFFDTLAEALREGYRLCRRCEPETGCSLNNIPEIATPHPPAQTTSPVDLGGLLAPSRNHQP